MLGAASRGRCGARPEAGVATAAQSPAHPRTFCLCESEDSRSLRQKSRVVFLLFVSGLFDLASGPQVYPCCRRVWVCLLRKAEWCSTVWTDRILFTPHRPEHRVAWPSAVVHCAALSVFVSVTYVQMPLQDTASRSSG